MAQILAFEQEYVELLANSYSFGARGTGAFNDFLNNDTSFPIIAVLSTPSDSQQCLKLSIADTGAGYALYYITCKDYPDNRRMSVYDPVDGGFVHPFNGRSTVTGTGTIPDPYIFYIYRRGRWPTNIALDIRVKAIDTLGNTTSQAVSITVNL